MASDGDASALPKTRSIFADECPMRIPAPVTQIFSQGTETKLKTILAITMAAALAGGLSAQECKKSCGAAAKTSLTQQDNKAKPGCCAAQQGTTKSSLLAKFNALKPEQQKEVATAHGSLRTACPIGSKVSSTVAALDRLYGTALTSLNKVAKVDQMSAAIKEDLGKQIALITKLSNLNKENLTILTTIAKKSGQVCCGSGDKSGDESCDESCDKSCCSAPKDCPIEGSTKLVKAWGGAQKEVSECAKCETTMASMKKDMGVFKKYGIDLKGFTVQRFAAQIQLLDKSCGQLACSRGGLKARHSETMNACSFTNENCTIGVNAIVAAHKLLNATPFAAKKAPKKAAAKKITSKTSNTGECPAVKAGCSASKSECSKAKQ